MLNANPYKSGVYQIVNMANGRVYVGSAAKDFKSRWQKHRSDLKLNKHANSRLQRAYNKYGASAFEYKVLAYCPAEYVLKMEQFFMDTIKPYYNICKVAGNSVGVKRTDEYKKKLSKSRTGHKASDEFREKARQRMLGNSYTKGMKMSPESIEARRQKQIGQKRSEECKRKISEATKGRVMSAENKKKVSDSRLTYVYSIQNIKTNEVHTTNNLRQFAITNGLHREHLNDTYSGVCHSGKRCLQHKGFKVIQKTLLQ